MKKLFTLLALAGLMMLQTPAAILAQEAQTEMAASDSASMDVDADSTAVDSTAVDSTAVDSTAVDSTAVAAPMVAEEPAEEKREVLSFHQTVKKYFIEGGATFMAFVLICLILGLALAIERIIYLNMATTNSAKLVEGIEDALRERRGRSCKGSVPKHARSSSDHLLPRPRPLFRKL